jgi:hypothetical protein
MQKERAEIWIVYKYVWKMNFVPVFCDGTYFVSFIKNHHSSERIAGIERKFPWD